jgi:hypothetical protein
MNPTPLNPEITIDHWKFILKILLVIAGFAVMCGGFKTTQDTQEKRIDRLETKVDKVVISMSRIEGKMRIDPNSISRN